MRFWMAILGAVWLGGCSGPSKWTPAPRPVTPLPAAAPDPVPPSPGYLVERISGLGMYPEEQRVAQKALARWARSKGMAVLDVDATEDQLAAFGRGRDPSGQACGQPLSRSEAVRRYRDTLRVTGRIQTTVWCNDKDGCTFSVLEVRGSGFDGKTVGRWKAAYVPGQAADAVVAQLAPYEPSGRGGLGLLGALNPEKTVVAKPERMTVDVYWSRADDRLAATEKPNVTVGGEVRSCFAAAASADVMVTVGDDGKLTRCASRSRETATSSCLCAALLKEGRGTAVTRGRRLSVHARFAPAEVVTPSNAVVRGYVRTHMRKDPEANRFLPNVSHPSVADWNAPSFTRIAPCFAARSEDTRFFIDTFFDARGKVRSSAIASKKTDLTAAETACVKEAFRWSSAPCPAVPKTGARAQVVVELKTIGAPKPSLEDVLNESIDKKPKASPE